VERGADEVPDPAPDQLLLDRGSIGIGLEVVDDDRALLADRPLVERSGELGGRVMSGVGEDARPLVARRVVQDQHAVSLHRREAEAQIGPPEERPELGLQPLEVGVRDDRVLVDEVPLEGGQDLLIGDVHRLDDHEAAQHEAVGGQEVAKKIRLDESGLQPLPQRIRERRSGSDDVDLHEAPVELQAEVLLEAGGGLGGREDDRDVAPDVDPVRSLEDQFVGEQEPGGGERLPRAVLLQEVRPALERPVRAHERAPEGRRRVERTELEGEEGRSVLLLPEGGGKDRGHHQVDERTVLLDDREVVDHPRQLGRLARLLAHETR
jgi:hypothetical protein